MTDEIPTIEAGQKMPEATIHTKSEDGIDAVETADYFKDCRVVMFALPGAFTTTCSARHLPGYIEHADKFKAAGFDKIACLAVNDAHVLRAWSLNSKAMVLLICLLIHWPAFQMRLALAVLWGQSWVAAPRVVRWSLIMAF